MIDVYPKCPSERELDASGIIPPGYGKMMMGSVANLASCAWLAGPSKERRQKQVGNSGEKEGISLTILPRKRKNEEKQTLGKGEGRWKEKGKEKRKGMVTRVVAIACCRVVWLNTWKKGKRGKEGEKNATLGCLLPDQRGRKQSTNGMETGRCRLRATGDQCKDRSFLRVARFLAYCLHVVVSK